MCADNLLYRVTPQNVGCIIETVFHMIIELLSLLVSVISWFSVSPPWSPTVHYWTVCLSVVMSSLIISRQFPLSYCGHLKTTELDEKFTLGL